MTEQDRTDLMDIALRFNRRCYGQRALMVSSGDWLWYTEHGMRQPVIVTPGDLLEWRNCSEIPIEDFVEMMIGYILEE